MARGDSHVEWIGQFRNHLHYFSARYHAGCQGCVVLSHDARSHFTWLSRCQAAGGIGSREGRKVGSRGRAGRQDPRLRQKEQTEQEGHHHSTQGKRKHRPRSTLGTDTDGSGPHGVAVSARAAAEAVRRHGINEPKAPPTGEEAVTVSHPPSSVTDDVTPSPASRLTAPSTEPMDSSRAAARAPALTASSSRNCVRPAAPPANRKASSSTTAGKATANSAVTAPCSRTAATTVLRAGSTSVMARTKPCG